MNNFDDVYALNRDERQISNLETYRRFISKGDKPLKCINDEDAKAIKDVLSGKGRVLAVADGRRSMAGNHKYVLFVKEEGGVKVYLYTILNGLYNEMGPYKDLDTAMSNADCYGLFEECKQVANIKVLENNMNKKLFEEIIDEWDEVADEVIDSIAEEVFNTYSEDMFNKLEFELNSSSIIGPDGRQDYGKLKDDIKAWSNIEDEIDLDEDPVSISEVYMQSQNYEDFFLDRLQYWMDCNEGNCLNESVKSRKLRENEDWDDDDVMTYDGDEMEDCSWDDFDDEYGGTVLGGDFDDDDSNFAMSDDADLDDWVREGKKVVFDNILKEGRNHNRVALRYAKSYEEFYDDDKHNAVAKQVEDVTGLPGWYVGEWGDGAIALVYSGDESDLTPEIVATARNIFKKAW